MEMTEEPTQRRTLLDVVLTNNVKTVCECEIWQEALSRISKKALPRVVYPSEQEIRLKSQKAYMDEQENPKKMKH